MTKHISWVTKAFLLASLATIYLSACGGGEPEVTDGEGTVAMAGEAGSGGSVDGSGGTAIGLGGQSAGGQDGGDGGAAGDPLGGFPTAPSGCEAVYTSCTGLCGPVTDPCTGESFGCGGCEDGEACDRATNSCVVPKLTCEDLGAECGRIRDTCGTRLDCGACPDNEQCDPDTNTCVACLGLTCDDLGYECGPAFLGCGARDNLTDCGECQDGFVCNVTYHRCEPTPEAEGGDCVPKDAEEACAPQTRAECGFVSDGCGGLVNCGGCPEGESCATGGIANRCGPPEAPWECLAAGRECGSVSSACGNDDILCGACEAPDVCNANGKCGPPCEPMLPAAAAFAACGDFDDGCGGTLKKPCETAGDVCTEDRNCCTPKSCADYPGKCGTALPDGCGGVINCSSCGSGAVCTESEPGVEGTCCTRNRSCDQVTCGTKVDDCGSTYNCGCASGDICNVPSGSQTGTCCEAPVCTTGDGDTCGTTISNACGTVSCGTRCGGGARACVGNECCPRPTRPDPNFCGRVDASDTADPDDCASRNYGCGGGRACINNSCCDRPAKPSPDFCGTVDSADTSDPDDCSTRTFNCGSGQTCVGNSCCTRNTCSSAAYAGKCGQNLDDGCGGTIDCNCSGAGNVCSTSASGATGTCSCTQNTCSDFTGQCGTFDNGCGGTITCDCADHGLPATDSCGGGGVPGECGCTPLTECGDRCGVVDNGCGSTLNCPPC